MYEVLVSIMSPTGDDLSYKTICDEEELNLLLRKYDRSEISYKKLY